MSDRMVLNALLRRYLLGFVIKAFGTVNSGTTFVENWHIEAILWQLQACAEGRVRRLLINQPPRSLKSFCVSVAWVAWCLGHDPSRKFVVASYSSELAGDLARQFRAIVDAPWYRALFPRFSIDKDTGLELVTSEGGGRLATSVGGSFTGRGADVIVIDDPMKAEDAVSDVARKRVIEWYRNTVVTRLNDKSRGVIVTVMQRLHEDDFSGHLIEQGGWAHLDLPAIAIEDEQIPIGPGRFHERKAGDLLQPDREPRDVLDQIKVAIGEFNFSAQYQQRPVPVEGNLIKWEWFRTYDSAPAQDRDGYIVQSWDTAQKVAENNDYSVCTTWLVKGSDYYLLDVVRERLDYPSLKRRVVELARRHNARCVLIEDKGAGTSLIQDLRIDQTGLRPIEIKPEGDKATRMATQAPAIEAGQVHLPRSAPWLDAFKAEFLSFPYGRHDDQVDSVAQFLGWRRESRMRMSRSGRAVGIYC